jgi:uncharacterized OB-fold protein
MNSPVQVWRTAKELHKYLGKKGKIVVWTRIFVAPAGYEPELPYVVAIVEFEDGTRKSLQVVDYDEKQLTTDQQVITTIRRIGRAAPDDVITYGLKVKPV